MSENIRMILGMVGMFVPTVIVLIILLYVAKSRREAEVKKVFIPVRSHYLWNQQDYCMNPSITGEYNGERVSYFVNYGFHRGKWYFGFFIHCPLSGEPYCSLAPNADGKAFEQCNEAIEQGATCILRYLEIYKDKELISLKDFEVINQLLKQVA